MTWRTNFSILLLLIIISMFFSLVPPSWSYYKIDDKKYINSGIWKICSIDTQTNEMGCSNTTKYYSKETEKTNLNIIRVYAFINIAIVFILIIMLFSPLHVYKNVMIILLIIHLLFTVLTLLIWYSQFRKLPPITGLTNKEVVTSMSSSFYSQIFLSIFVLSAIFYLVINKSK